MFVVLATILKFTDMKLNVFIECSKLFFHDNLTLSHSIIDLYRSINLIICWLSNSFLYAGEGGVSLRAPPHKSPK